MISLERVAVTNNLTSKTFILLEEWLLLIDLDIYLLSLENVIVLANREISELKLGLIDHLIPVLLKKLFVH